MVPDQTGKARVQGVVWEITVDPGVRETGTGKGVAKAAAVDWVTVVMEQIPGRVIPVLKPGWMTCKLPLKILTGCPEKIGEVESYM